MRKRNPKLSVIIIAKNEEEKIKDCLESVKWVDEIILIDSGSTDGTRDIAKKFGAKIFEATGGSYDKWRNEGLRRAKGKWLLYIDADERINDSLRNEIDSLITDYSPSQRLSRVGDQSPITCYAIPRRNIILGREMKHGGWWPDYVKRLYKKDALKGWKGKLHEEPVFDGLMGHVKSPLVHKKHKYLSEMVEKTNKWSEIEAKMLFDSNHPRMTWWRFFRIMATELWHRLIVKRGFLDGVEGIIYAIYQMWSKFITYAKLWEMQIRNK